MRLVPESSVPRALAILNGGNAPAATIAALEPLEPLEITRRAPGPHDVQIEIAYCGICHSDLHQARAEWAGTHWPCVPGHEIVGRVSAVGAHVSGFRRGDFVGIGCIVDSCRHCPDCEDGEATISRAVRAFDLRRARYMGLAKTCLQHMATAAAMNLLRIGSWLEGSPIAPTRQAHFGQLVGVARTS